MTFKEELAKYDLEPYYSDAPDREPIDFSVSDSDDCVAWVWGTYQTNDIQVECNHPDVCIEWGDDDECGECLLCGAQCHWHWGSEVVDNYPDEIKEVKVRVPHEWEYPNGVGGIIGRYIEHLRKGA